MIWSKTQAIKAANKDRKLRGICLRGYREGEKDSSGQIHTHTKECENS